MNNIITLKTTEFSTNIVKDLLKKVSLDELNFILNVLNTKSTSKQKNKKLNTLFSKEESFALIDQYENQLTNFTALTKLTGKRLSKTENLPYVNEIFTADLGYNRNIITFYQVVKVSKCSVWIKELDKKITKNCDGYNQQTYVRPVEKSYNKNNGTILMRRFKQYNGTLYVNINNYSYAKPWDGQDIYEDSLD